MNQMKTDAPRYRTPPSWVVMGFLVLGVMAVGAAFLLPVPKRLDPASAIPVVQPPQYPDAPFFQLTERNGQEISTADLDGKVWIASFQFTRCKYCPNVSATLAKLQKEIDLANRDDVRFVTFTIDPEYDTPDELKKYADNFRADPKKWWFLTGKEKYVHLLANRGFLVAASKNLAAPVNMRFDHTLKLLLVDKLGHIRGTFDGMIGEPTPEQNTTDADLALLKQKYDDSYADLKKQIELLTKK